MKGKKRKAVLTILGVVLACTVVALVVLALVPPKKRYDARFDGTTSITIVSFPKGREGEAGTQRKMVIDDSRVLSRILKEIDLQPKEPCMCAHWTKMFFKTSHGVVEVSLCGHCFDIVNGKDRELYKMPKPLYIEIKGFVDKLREPLANKTATP
jgi:hypothetical protein